MDQWWAIFWSAIIVFVMALFALIIRPANECWKIDGLPVVGIFEIECVTAHRPSSAAPDAANPK